MTFFIRPPGENVHTNLSGVRKCQRRHQNEIIFYHFPFSHPSNQHLTFHITSVQFLFFFIRFVGTRKAKEREIVCECARARENRASECVCQLTNVPYAIDYIPRQSAASQIKIYSIEECFQQFSVQRL